LDALRKEAVSVLVLFFTAQSRVLGHSPKISEFVVARLALMDNFPDILAQIQSKNQVRTRPAKFSAWKEN
jgi:hypothetical protein